MNRKTVSGIMLTLLLIGMLTLAFNIQSVKAGTHTRATASLTVTETNDYVTVENTYFITNISKHSGVISAFYVKPEISTNIVSEQGYPALGGWEQCSNFGGGVSKSSAHWIWDSIQSVDVTIVSEDSSTVTVKAVTDFGYNPSTLNDHIEFRSIYYWTFFADKPYYVASTSRVYDEDLHSPYNPQLCFLMEPDKYWNFVSGTCTWSALNETYQVETNSTRAFAANFGESYVHKQFPWVWTYNYTLGFGYGVVLIDVYPHPSIALLGFCGGGSEVAKYTEFQIDVTTPEATNTPDTISYVAYINNSASYTGIDDLSKKLFTDEKQVFDDVFLPVGSNFNSTYARGGFGRAGLITGRPYSTYWKAVANSVLKFYFVNTTSSYLTYDWDNTITKPWVWNTTYTNFTWVTTFEDKFKTYITIQVWNYSDTVRTTYRVETLTAVNVTNFQMLWSSGYSGQHFCQLSSSFYKTNGSKSAWGVSEKGFVINNLTAPAKMTFAGAFTYWYFVDNLADVEYPTGTTWTMDFYVQRFWHYAWQNRTFFSISNFSIPSEKETLIMDANIRFWLPMPLFNQEGSLRLLQVDNLNSSHIGYTGFSESKLTIQLFGHDSATYRLFCGNKGEPTSVTGATSWSYDSSSKICTITVTHSSHVDVEVDWSDDIHSVYILNVYVKRGSSTVANANVTIEGDTKQTNLFGTCTFELPTDHYEVTANYGDVTKTKRVLLKRNKTIAINLPKKKGRIHM